MQDEPVCDRSAHNPKSGAKEKIHKPRVHVNNVEISRISRERIGDTDNDALHDLGAKRVVEIGDAHIVRHTEMRRVPAKDLHFRLGVPRGADQEVPQRGLEETLLVLDADAPFKTRSRRDNDCTPLACTVVKKGPGLRARRKLGEEAPEQKRIGAFVDRRLCSRAGAFQHRLNSGGGAMTAVEGKFVHREPKRCPGTIAPTHAGEPAQRRQKPVKGENTQRRSASMQPLDRPLSAIASLHIDADKQSKTAVS